MRKLELIVTMMTSQKFCNIHNFERLANVTKRKNIHNINHIAVFETTHVVTPTKFFFLTFI